MYVALATNVFEAWTYGGSDQKLLHPLIIHYNNNNTY